MTVLWVTAALLIAGTVIFLASAHTRRLLPDIELPEGEVLPKTALQRLAGRALAAILLLCISAAGIVAWQGPQLWWDSDPVRLTVTFILLAALAVYFGFSLRIRQLESREDGSFDERDGIILGRSCAGVGGAMMVIVAGWSVALTEAFIATRLVPSYYLYLIFWSCVMTNVAASLAGILLAYRRG